jgi:O-acetylserine/cysteine efflux transporter
VITLFLLPFMPKPRIGQIGPIAVISVFMGGLHEGLFFQGMAAGPGSVVAVVHQLTTPFIVLLAWPLLGDRPKGSALIGILVAIGGVALLGIGATARANNEGVVFMALSALAFAFASVLAKRFGRFDPLLLMAWTSLFTVPQLGVASWMLEVEHARSIHAMDAYGWLAFAYSVLFAGIVGNALWFWLIDKCSLSSVAPYALLSPVFGIGSSVLLSDEPLTGRLVIAAAVTIAGVALTQTESLRQKGSAPPLEAGRQAGSSGHIGQQWRRSTRIRAARCRAD